MEPSKQQQAVQTFVRDPRAGNLVLEAVAGSGKTSTLLLVLEDMRGSVAFCAYNKSIAAEIAAKVARLTTAAKVEAKTFHSFGFSALRKACPNIVVEDTKSRAAFRALTRGNLGDEVLERFTTSLVSLAKQNAIGLLQPFDRDEAWWNLVTHHDLTDTLLANPFKRDEYTEAQLNDLTVRGMSLAYDILQRSVADHKTADFDDMIYMPLILGARVWQHDWVLIDEAQDTNPARRALAKKMLRPGGRVIAVGDPHQAIYGFTGADADSLDLIRAEFGAKTLPLSVTYRCAKRIVAHAQRDVSHIEAHPESPEGLVRTLDSGAFAQEWPALTSDDVVLCRNMRPLVSIAYGMIKRGIGCHVEGREIGAGLLNLTRKWSLTKTVEALREKLVSYLGHETQKLLAKGEETKAAAITDRVETLLIIMGELADDAPVEEVTVAVNKLFADVPPGQKSPNVTLSTIHKSKGREWRRVYLYGRNRFMPSVFARQDWQLEQERNLSYVAVTRALLELVEVTAPVSD